MTSIVDLLQAGPTWSVEFFPPRDERAESQLAATLSALAPLEPTFASVTYGALGSTKTRTRDLVVQMNAAYDFPTMAHLTCVGHTRSEIDALLDDYAARGVRNILALGGDPPADGSAPEGDFAHAGELVEVVRAHPAGFGVGVAAHPELHPRSPNRDSDRRHLAHKLREADFAITQFFFDVDDYLRMVDELAARGCHRPVIPGVMPFVSAAGLLRMAAMNHTRVPDTLRGALDSAAGADEITRLGVEVATTLCAQLIEAGAPGIHLYTLNRAASVRQIHEAIQPRVAEH